MKEYRISVNQLADFTKGTDGKKRSIIKQQKNPQKIIVARYALAKARIRKAVATRGDISALLNGIEQLKNKKPETNWQINDKKVSLEAMERFIKLKLPNLLKELDSYEILKKFEFKSFNFSGVDIIVSPDLIIKGIIGNKVYIGAVKIHISKSGPFDYEQSRYVSTCIYNYLKTMIKEDEIIVLPELCLCIDVFADTIISAPRNINYVNEKLKKYCKEVIKFWDAA